MPSNLGKRYNVDWTDTDPNSASYIINKPLVSAFNQIPADWNATTGVAVILNKPTIAGAGPVAPTVGPTSPQGLTGSTGQQGIQGIQGLTGPTGPVGPQGTTGSNATRNPPALVWTALPGASGTAMYTTTAQQVVMLRGSAVLSSSAIGTLPVGYRPTLYARFLSAPCLSGSTWSTCVLQVDTTGIITLFSTSSGTAYLHCLFFGV